MPNATPATSSTAQVNISPFNQHGVVDIRMDGRVIHYQATGPFNTELLDSLAIAQRDFLLAAQPQHPWVSIATIRVSAMTSPDGLARYAAIMAAPKPDFMIPVATAFVMGPEVEGNIIMAQHYRKIYRDIRRPFQIFATLPEAQAWVLAQLPPSAAG